MSDKKKRDYLHLSPGADRKFEAIIVLEGTPKSDVGRRAVSLLIEDYEKKNGDIDVLLSKHNKDDDNKKIRQHLHLSPTHKRKLEGIAVLEGEQKAVIGRRAVNLLIENFEREKGKSIDKLLKKHNKE
mgnify:CR=1 FL=1